MFGVTILLLAGIMAYRVFYLDKKTATVDTPVSADTYKYPLGDVPTENPPVVALPEQALLNVPFTSQAPLANWDATHEETCEEASLLMVKHYIKGTTFGSTNQADSELLDLVAWEEANGYKIDVTTTELSQIAKSKYGLSTGRVKKNATIDDIKREIANGHPVIVGAAGKVLPNPNFRNGGPNYHMLVVKGYDKDGFITNDPGTRLGNNFRYTFDAFYNAIHDWDPNNILNGGKNYLVFD